MPEVARLADLCKRVLQANVASLQDVGDVPYPFLRDILPGCRVDQLREIEDLSPHIAEEDEGAFRLYAKQSRLSADRFYLLQRSGRPSSSETFPS